jgi:hypothetical protein
MHNDNSLHYCRVCGHYNVDLPWGKNGSLPSFNICDCCGSEFGYHDFSIIGIRRQREAWLKHADNWNNPSAKPKDWNLEAQLKNIPKQFL